MMDMNFRETSGSSSQSNDTDAWTDINQQIRSLLPEEVYSIWIEPISAQIQDNKLELTAPNSTFQQGLNEHYLEIIKCCAQEKGWGHLTIEVILAPQELPEQDNLTLEASENGSPKDASAFSSKPETTTKLNPNYTFQNFVRGPSNQFALATCLNVAENPGQNYNPLFLYGSTGLGKTHLLHAVGNQVLAINPSAIVTYISSERFMNEMIYCIRHNKMWDFRQKYRNCDVFMVDDIQFISGNKAATQEEFFHTFNTLYEAKKQIIITSDLFPQDIPDIEERLRNRFQWGLIADIQPPDVEHRIAILMNKADSLGVQLSYDVGEYIANHANRNIRELEGALHRLAAFATLQGRPLNKSLAQEIFRSVLPEPPKELGVETVQKLVAEHFKIKVSDLKSKKRQRSLSLPRQIAMYLCRQYTEASFPDIGDKFGGKNHTTVMHAVKKVDNDRLKDLELKTCLETLGRRLDQTSKQ
ncbi:MAG: chromosomal replication initiator protein DnaA [Oligoflexales bacterium]